MDLLELLTSSQPKKQKSLSEDYYDYSHFEYINDMMNQSFVETVLEVGEDYYEEEEDYEDYEDYQEENMAQNNLDSDDVTQEQMNDDQTSHDQLEDDHRTEYDHKTQPSNQDGADTGSHAQEENRLESGFEFHQTFVKGEGIVPEHSAVNKADKKGNKNSRKAENEVIVKESPLVMNSAVSVKNKFMLILLLSIILY